MSSSEKLCQIKCACHIAYCIWQYCILSYCISFETSDTCCKGRLMLHGRWDWIRTLHRELIKALFLVGAFSKAVNAQMITDYMFPRNNRTIYFKKCIMTLFLVGGISASRTKAGPAIVLSCCSLHWKLCHIQNLQEAKMEK